MKHVWVGLACLAMLTGSQLSAQNQEDQDKQQNKREQSQRGGEKGQQQTIRGTVAGVTSIGEAVIDPQSNQAVVVEVNYLTILGSPAGGKASQSQKGNTKSKGKEIQSSQTSQSSRGRQNVYLVAISPQTKIRSGAQGQQDQEASSKAGQQEQNQSAFERLEIGDRVEIQFESTQRLQAKSTDSERDEERTAGFRGGDQSQKHGRNRIFVGQASEIKIIPEGEEQIGQSRKQQNKKSETGNQRAL